MVRTVLAAGLAAMGLIALASPAEAVATRTVAFYSLDEAPGSTTLVDSSRNGRDGAIGSLVTPGATYEGVTGHRFATHLPADGAFPGHSNTVPHHTDLNPDSGDFSVTIRYRTRYNFGNILQKGQGTAVGGYWKFEAPNGQPRCLFRGGNGASRTGYYNTPLSDDQWHTVRCVRTADYVEMYVDGVRTSRLNGPTGNIANNAQLSMGGKSQCDGVETTCDYFVGDIDYVRIEKGSGGAANVAPVASPQLSCAGLVCTASGAGSTDSDGAIQRYQWDFGDGTVVDGVSIPTASHAYSQAGQYAVKLTVTDDRGATSSSTQTVDVAPVAEKISFVGQRTSNANAASHSAVMPVGLRAGDRLLMFFSQNNQVTTTGPTGVTGWTQLDSRSAGGFGRTTVWSKTATAADVGTTVRIPLSGPAKGNLVVAAYRGTDGTTPTLVGKTDSTSSASRTTPTATVARDQSWGVSYWMHGDGASNSLTAPNGVAVRSNSSQTGGGRVTALLADSNASVPTGGYGGLQATGATASTTSTSYTVILAPERGDEPPPPNEPPTAQLSASCAALTCTFSAVGSNDPDGSIADFTWDLGDGSDEAADWGATGTHTYAAPGSYTAELTVTDDAGATSTASRILVVNENQQQEITFVGSRTTNVNAVAHTVAPPGGVQTGDALLLFFSQNNTAATTGPAGWTQVGTRTSGTSKTTIWKKVATAQDTTSTATARVTLSSQAKGNLVMAAYRGTDTQDPVAVFAATSGASAVTHATPTANVANGRSWAISYWMHVDAATTTMTPPAGVTVRSNSSQTGSGRVTALLADSGGAAPTGSYGGLVAGAAASSSKWTAWTLVLSPAG